MRRIELFEQRSRLYFQAMADSQAIVATRTWNQGHNGQPQHMQSLLACRACQCKDMSSEEFLPADASPRAGPAPVTLGQRRDHRSASWQTEALLAHLASFSISMNDLRVAWPQLLLHLSCSHLKLSMLGTGICMGVLIKIKPDSAAPVQVILAFSEPFWPGDFFDVVCPGGFMHEYWVSKPPPSMQPLSPQSLPQGNIWHPLLRLPF